MAFDAFLKLDGIKGESVDAKHKDEIQIESFSWGLSNSSTFASGGGTGAGKASFQDFSFTTALSAATPQLFVNCASGKHLKEGLLTLRKAGEQPLEYLKIKFEDIIVTSVVEGGSTEGDTPLDEVALIFGAVEVEYTPQNADGSAGTPIKGGWDLKQNVAK